MALVVAAHDAELGGEHDLVAAVGDGAADQLLVGAAAVHVGGVEKVDAELERAVDGGDRFRLAAAHVEVGHAHAAEPERGDLQLAEVAVLHGGLLRWAHRRTRGAAGCHVS